MVSEILVVGITVIIFAVSVFSFGMAIRHFFPLIRGFNGPVWVHEVAPIAFFFDRYFS